MSSLKQALQEHLITAGRVAALVGNRVFVGHLPQSAKLPAVVLMQVASAPENYQGGATSAAMARMQITSYAASNREAEQIKEAVRLSLSGFAGNLGPAGDAVAVMIATHVGDRDGFERDQAGGDGGAGFVASDYEIWHRAEVPSFD